MILIQTIIFGLTLIAIIWYAELTRRINREIKRQADTALLSHQSYKLSVAAEWLLKLDNQFEQLYGARCNAVSSLRHSRDISPAYARLWNFFETLGLLLRLGILDRGMLNVVFGYWIQGYWEASEQFIIRSREREESLWSNFEYLYSELQQTRPRMTPDQLNSFLQSEEAWTDSQIQAEVMRNT